MSVKDFMKRINAIALQSKLNVEAGIEETYNKFSQEFANRNYDIPTNIQKGEIDKAIEDLEHIGFHTYNLWKILKAKGADAPETVNPEFPKESSQ